MSGVDLVTRLKSAKDLAPHERDDLKRRLVKFFECNSCFAAEHFAGMTLKNIERKLRLAGNVDVFEEAQTILTESRCFENLLALLGPDRESAGEEYERVRRKLFRFFNHFDCSPGDEYVDMTLERVAHKLDAQPVRNIKAFIMGFAKNIVREACRRPLMIDDCNWDQWLEGERVEQVRNEQETDELRMQCLSQCIEKLPYGARKLFLDYYIEAEKHGGQRAQYRRSLAERLRLKLNNLHQRAHRLMDKIENCVRDRFEKSSQGLIQG